jgi:hypothetical protein
MKIKTKERGIELDKKLIDEIMREIGLEHIDDETEQE